MACIAIAPVEKARKDLFVTTGLSDELLATIYHILEADGMMQRVLYEGGGGIQWWLKFHRKPGNVNYGCFVRRSDGTVELAGMGWIDSVSKLGSGHLKAEVGMAFQRKFQKFDITSDFATRMLDMAFSQANLSVAYGITAEPNRAAVIFARRMGFTELCRAPMYCSWQQEPCNGVVLCMTKTAWGRKRNRVEVPHGG